jgi:hypothetical protein
MNTIQFVLIMAWFGAALAALGWIYQQTATSQPSRLYKAATHTWDGLVDGFVKILPKPLLRWLDESR